VFPKIKGEFPRVIDSTIRADAVSCPTKFYYSFIRKLGSPFPSVDLIAGGAFAKGIESLRLAYYWEKKSLEDSLNTAMSEALAYYMEELGENGIPENKEQKGPDRVCTALAAYVDKYHPDTDHLQPHFAPNGKPMVEFTFSVPLPILHPDTAEPIIYAGRFDMVGVYNKGMLLGVDEKTTSQLGPTWKNQWNLRGQFTGYTWALRQYHFNVGGCIARGVSFLKNSHGFEESLQLRPDYMIDQWYEQLLHDVERMKQAWVDGWFDQNFSDACTGFSGCPFQKLCTSADPEIFTGQYGIRDWDPLKKVPFKQPNVPVEQIEVPDELRALMARNGI
jgi:hypothetical protein